MFSFDFRGRKTQEGLSELQEKRGEMQETNACDNGGHLVGDVCLRVFGAARSWGPCPLPARSLPHPLDSPAVSFLGPWAGSPCSPGPSRLHLPGRHLLVPPVPAGRRRGRAVTELNSRCFSGQAAQAAQGLPGVLLSATGDGGGGVGGELGCEPTCPLMPQRVRPRPISRDLRRQLSGRGPRKYRLGAMGTGMGVPTPLLTPRAPDAFPQGILAHKTQTGTPASAKEPTAVSGPPPQMLLRPLSRTAAAAVFPTRLLGTHTGGAGIPPPPNKVSEAETGAREVFQSPTGATPPPPQVDDWLCPEREVKGGAGALNPAAGPASDYEFTRHCGVTDDGNQLDFPFAPCPPGLCNRNWAEQCGQCPDRPLPPARPPAARDGRLQVRCSPKPIPSRSLCQMENATVPKMPTAPSSPSPRSPGPSPGEGPKGPPPTLVPPFFAGSMVWFVVGAAAFLATGLLLWAAVQVARRRADNKKVAQAGEVWKFFPLSEESVPPTLARQPLSRLLDELEVLEELVILLDPEPGPYGGSAWGTTRHLASRYGLPASWATFAYSLRPAHSPLRALLETVTTRDPTAQLGQLAHHLSQLGRGDALGVLHKLLQPPPPPSPAWKPPAVGTDPL
ncbi:IGF-like family receptor 1 isoform 3-T3 [Sarcophilus harrisii]